MPRPFSIADGHIFRRNRRACSRQSGTNMPRQRPTALRCGTDAPHLVAAWGNRHAAPLGYRGTDAPHSPAGGTNAPLSPTGGTRIPTIFARNRYAACPLARGTDMPRPAPCPSPAPSWNKCAASPPARGTIAPRLPGSAEQICRLPAGARGTDVPRNKSAAAHSPGAKSRVHGFGARC
jgi:hypothetical protein